MKSTEESLYLAIDMVKPGIRLGDIGAAIQKYNEDNGYSVVREFVGHGVGRESCMRILRFRIWESRSWSKISSRNGYCN